MDDCKRENKRILYHICVLPDRIRNTFIFTFDIYPRFIRSEKRKIRLLKHVL